MPWPDAPSVLELPDGRRVRGLRRPVPAGPDPEFGVYLGRLESPRPD